MKQIQILLPLYEKTGETIPNEVFFKIREELAEKFGGITTYTRSPATGLWKDEKEKTVKDDIIIYEVMTKELDRIWWKGYKVKLEEIFKQDEIIARVWDIEML